MWPPYNITIHGDVATWLIAAGTLLLAGATGALAIAAWKALGQLHLATRQLDVAIRQLDEAKKDRHVQVFADMGSRWDGSGMVEALRKEKDYSTRRLGRLFARAYAPPSRNPLRTAASKRAGRKTTVLLRIPNFFENLALLI